MEEEEFQDLKRENFNLKLRIFFLEEQNQFNFNNIDDQTHTSYIQQLKNEIEQLRQRLQSQTIQSDSLQTVYNFDHDDERQALRKELENCRREKELLRQSLQLNSNKIHGEDGKNFSTTLPTVGQSLTTTASFDSGLDTTTSKMSSTFFNSTNALQIELNESKERERKLEEQINLLRQQIESSRSQTNETLAELDRARRQIQQYQVDIQNYEQQQSKAERVLQRLKNDYENRITNLVEQQRQQQADFETYQHEPLLARIRFFYSLDEETASNHNIDELHQAIIDRDRIIKQLEEAIGEITTRLQTPFTLMLSELPIDRNWSDERSQKLIRELNTQMQTHLKMVDQLRAECAELRRSETNLKNQIDNLTRLINTPSRNLGLPPLSRPTTTSSKIVDSIDDAKQIQDLQTAIVQVTLQLQSDAENVSGLTNRVANIFRDRDEWQEKIDRLQDELDKKIAHIRQLEKREPEVENRLRQQYLSQIEAFQLDIQRLKEELRERDRVLNEIKHDKEDTKLKARKDYERLDGIHNQERQNFHEQLRTSNERIVQLEKQLNEQRKQFEDLQRKYDKAKSTTETLADQLEREIQQQRTQIEELNIQIRHMENNFQKERRQLEKERDIEKERNFEIQNALSNTNKQNNDLQTEYHRLQTIFDTQRNEHEQQIRILQNQINQSNRGNEHFTTEIQNLKRENQNFKDRSFETEQKISELTKRNKEYEIRFHDNDEIDKRYRNEIDKFQRDIEHFSKENQEWKLKYEAIKNDLNNLRYEKERLESKNQMLNEENGKLQRNFNELSNRTQNDYEEKFRQLNIRKDKEIQNIEKDKENLRLDLEQMNNERSRLQDRLNLVENNLKQTNQTITNYENDIDRLRQALTKANEKYAEIENDVSRAYSEELRMKTNRLQDLEGKYQLTETQINQYRQENTKLVENNQRLQDEYERYRYEQENNFDTLKRNAENAAKENVLKFETRLRQEVFQVNENKQQLIDQLEERLREKEKIINKLENERSLNQPKDIQLDLEIRVDQLEQEVEVKEDSIKTYGVTLQEKDQQIEKLRYNIRQNEIDRNSTIESFQNEIKKHDRQIQQLSTDYENRLTQLQTNINNRDREIIQANDKFQQIEQKLIIQQREFEDCRRKHENLIADFNIVTAENEAYSDRIKLLEKQLEMIQSRNPTPEQIAHYQSIIDDLKSKLRQRDDSVQSLQLTISDSDRELKEARQSRNTMQDDYNRAQLRFEKVDKQFITDLENREQIITALRKKVAEKDQEIQKLRESDSAKEAVINKLRSKSRESDQDSRSEYSGARAPTNVALRLELQKKDEEIDKLRRELDRIRRDNSPNGREDSSSLQYAQRAEVRRRPQTKNFDHLNRDELLYELEMALQDNEGLVQQLAQKSPNITELHNQLLDVRKELARQKYVNQVLWRKLDALLDIHGSNTRAELAIELANYHDEVEALRAKQHRSNDARAAILNASSRSSSETSLNKKDSGVESVIDSTRHTLAQQEYQRQISDKDDQIRHLTIQFNDLKKAHENQLNEYRLKFEKSRTDLVDDLNDKQNDLRQARLQVELLKSTKIQLEQAQDQNQRLQREIKLLQDEIGNKNELISHYEKQINLLEKQVASSDRGTGEMTIRTSEMSELLEEMRRLRYDLERSVNKQNELQMKLDENMRLSRTPREFTFSGRGVSYPDLHIIDASGSVGNENLSVSTIIDEKRSRPLGSSTTEIDLGKMYIVSEVETHENLRKLITDMKMELKALEVKIKEKLRSKFTTSLTEPSIEWLEHRLNTLTQCLARLEQIYQLMETYWKAYLPIKNSFNEHPFNDQRLTNENKELRLSQSKYMQELNNLKQKYKEQSIYMDQVLGQLTKANHKKANSDDYLALLLRPTLDVLQKARSNMENHLKESNNTNFLSSDSIQSIHRFHTNRLD